MRRKASTPVALVVVVVLGALFSAISHLGVQPFTTPTTSSASAATSPLAAATGPILDVAPEPQARAAGAPAVLARHQIAPRMMALLVNSFDSSQQALVEQLAKSECTSASMLCSIGVWTDAAALPQRLKMTPKQFSARVFQYTWSPHTKVTSEMWDCRRFPHPASSCLASSPITQAKPTQLGPEPFQ